MPNLNESVLQNMPVVLPSLPEQRAIAHVLGTLENKIELNRRMNTTREAMARAIFQSWFVDFDPVHAKARGEQPSGMDAATAALFPDSFEESELGPIPRGWRVAPLDEIADYQNGLALQKFPPQGDRFLPVLKIRELRQGYVDNNSNLADPDISEDCIVYNGNVVFSWSGSLLVDIWCGGMVALNQHLFKVTSEHYPKWFYYLWTLYHLREFQHIAAGKATTMGHIKRHHLSDALTVVPTDEVLQRADQIIAPFLHTIINYRLESRTLAELRDTLLPLLISGQIRIAAGANR
jgi:type I restriction enzyme S subunit